MHPPANILLTAAFLTLAGGCFQQTAPERIPSAETLLECLKAPETLEFAHLSAEFEALKSFPAELSGCPRLWKLGLRGQTVLAPLDPAIGGLKGLRWLDLSEIGLADLPAEVGTLPLRRLYLSDNKFDHLPAAVAALHDLDYLNLDRNHLQDLPPEVGGWTALRWLRLNANRLGDLPAEASRWTALERLYLRENAFETVPAAITALPALQQLDLGRNPKLATVPDSIGDLVSLTRLDLDYTAVTNLPDTIGRLRNLRTLVLYGAPISAEEVARVRELLPEGCDVEF